MRLTQEQLDNLRKALKGAVPWESYTYQTHFENLLDTIDALTAERDVMSRIEALSPDAIRRAAWHDAKIIAGAIDAAFPPTPGGYVPASRVEQVAAEARRDEAEYWFGKMIEGCTLPVAVPEWAGRRLTANRLAALPASGQAASTCPSCGHRVHSGVSCLESDACGCGQ
jgi:hypothetical protein